MKPTGPLPAAIRASFTAAMRDATMGAAADVPPLVFSSPSVTTTVGNLGSARELWFSRLNRMTDAASYPFADMSGYARPERLKVSAG